MPYPEIERLSPNRDLTPKHEQLGVLFHHTVIGYGETIALMTSPDSKVSYHCLIDSNGERCTLVHDDAIAWHAGLSQFFGRSRCNEFLLGVAFAGDTYKAPLTSHQMASAIEWLSRRWQARGWTLDAMTDHRQVSPGRKDDLNPVEWARLRSAIAARFSP